MKMAEIKTIYKGESVTLLFTFPEAYDMTRLASHKIFVGETEFTGVIEGQAIRMQLKSSDTNRMIGTHRIVCLIDDMTLGLRKPYCGELIIAKTQASGSTTSVSNISDIIIPIVISETSITVGDVLYNYVKGDKGDPFIYSDFTPEQIEALKVKGDAFEYSDFTPEQISELKGASAYQIWLSLGNNGTEQDFINSLAAGGIDLSSYLTELEASGLYQPKGTYLTAETDPTVPAWAKTPAKPNYTASEVGASESNHTHTDLHIHSNKTVLDATTASFTIADESKLDGLSNYTHPATHSIAEVSGLQTALDGKVDDGQVLTNVPAGAVFTDTVYTHPASHPASIIEQDASSRFVSDTEKSTWNGKANATHTHDDRYYTESEVNALLAAKKGAYDAEIITSPTIGTLMLKNSTETVLDGSLTSSNVFTVALPTPTAGQVNESILIFKIGASLPTITQPTGIVWRGATPTLKISTNWTIVYEQVNTTGTTFETWAVATKNA